MIETYNSEKHASYVDGRKLVSQIEAGKNVSLYESVESEDRAQTAHGNHVLALPYWSEFKQLNKTDKQDYVEIYTGTIYTSKSTTREATIHDWPWPEKPGFGSASLNNFAIQAKWGFNLTRFLSHPTLSLPQGSDIDWNLLIRLADTKALGNVRKGLINLPLIMLERRETLRMIASKVQLMAKSAKALQTKSSAEYARAKKKKPITRRNVARRIASEHLEFVFGWLPTISEVEGLAELVQADRLDFIRSRGVQVLRTETKLDYLPVVAKPLTKTLLSVSYFGKVKTVGIERSSIGVRTALRYKLSSKLIGDAYRIGFEPISNAFDFIPLSFLTGWISNFDYWIRTLAPEIGIEFETGSRNRRMSHSFQVEGEYIPSTLGNQHHAPVKTKANGSYRRDEREVLHEAPSASLEWDVEVGLYEVTAGASLLIQRFLKPLKRDILAKPFRYKGPRPKWLKEIRYTGRKLTNV